jgi:very-short-patch-repair endonuclease
MRKFHFPPPFTGEVPRSGGGGMREGEKRSRRFARRLRRELTNAETILWSRLRRHPVCKFRRQHPIGAYIADFACIARRLVVEIDGETHATEAQHRYDRTRGAYLESRGWRVLRVWNADIYRALDGVLDLIESSLKCPPPSRAAHAPPPP